jgi:hypothetical protein
MPLGDPPDYRVYQTPMWHTGQEVIDVPPAVAGILVTLPAPGVAWPAVEKARFMAAMGAVLDLVYPEPDSASGEPK